MQRQQKQKRGVDGLAADSDEWDDLPFVRGAAPPPHLTQPDHRQPHPHQPPQHQQHPYQPRRQPPPRQQLRHTPQQRKRSRDSGDLPVTKAPAAGAGARSSHNPGFFSGAMRVPSSANAAPVAVAPPSLAANQQQQQKKKERERVLCRAFAAGFCPAGVRCFDIHDGRAVEERRKAWLAGGPLPDPQPPQWSLMVETATRGGGPFGSLPGVAPGVPPVLVIADVATKHKITEFVCLAMETSTGRQLGRFARFVRVLPTVQPASPLVTLAPQLIMPSQQQPHPQMQQPQQLPQQPQQALMYHPPGATIPGGVSVDGAEVKPVGVTNPLTSALPLPDVLQELQQWMASLGLNPGSRDAVGFSECGNFRWVVTHGSGFNNLPELIGQHKLQLPDHLRSWTDAARMCGWKADQEDARNAAANTVDRRKQANGGGSGGGGPRSQAVPGPRGAGAEAGGANQLQMRPPKKHSLPQSGLPGMLKFLGCPKEPDIPNRTRRGMNVVESLAQCVVCMVRLGVPMPVTSRITQEWGVAGEYAGCRHDELAIQPSQVVLIGTPLGSNGMPAAGVGTGAIIPPGSQPDPQGMVGGRPPMMVNAPNPSGFKGNTNGASAPQLQKKGKKKNKQNKQEHNNNSNSNNNSNKNNGVSTNNLFTPSRMEGPPLLGAPAQHEQQQQQLGGEGRGGTQWQNGLPGGGGRAQPVPPWRQNVPVHYLAADYLDYFVRERERQYYKSAGILPYRRDPASGEVWVLLGSEIRKNKMVVSCLGGKREDSDAGPEHTAWREFWEESGKVLGDNERASFLTACFEGRARAMWMQSAKMAVLACELSSPNFVSLPRLFALGGPGVDKRHTSMVALHWVSATELHNACNQRGGKVVIWGPAPQSAPQQGAAPPPQQQMNGLGPAEERPGGLSKRQQKKLQMQHRAAGRVGGGGGNGMSLPLQLPLQQQVLPMTPPIVPTSVDPYQVLRSLVADPAFQLFFAQLAAAGSSNQRFVPVLNGTA